MMSGVVISTESKIPMSLVFDICAVRASFKSIPHMFLAFYMDFLLPCSPGLQS